MTAKPDTVATVSSDELLETDHGESGATSKPARTNLPATADQLCTEDLDDYRHTQFGKPHHRWLYHDAEGHLVGAIARWDGVEEGTSKTIRPLTYQQTEGRRFRWRSGGFPEPRPLYRLPEIIKNPTKSILICEGEKAAGAAQELFPDYVATTPPHGAQSPHKADWSSVRGRDVVVWPDNDEPGRDFAQKVAKPASEAGAAEIRIVEIPGDFPETWDLADDLPEGMSESDIRALMDEAQLWVPTAPKHYVSCGSFRSDERGVYQLSSDANKPDVFLCDPLEVLAGSRDFDGDNWGKILRWTDPDGIVHKWPLPLELLAGDGAEIRREFLRQGLNVGTSTFARQQLLTYLQQANPDARVHVVDRVGWHENCFVFPDGAIHPDDGEEVLFQSTTQLDHAYRQAGSLEDWQNEVAALAVGNNRLMFVICCALAAPLLKMTDSESGGFHLRGASSTGKTTALNMAGSVFGGGGTHGYTRQWRTTDNALEGVAATHCDTLLCLDELSQIDGRHAGNIAYMLANGQGKGRAKQTGSNRPVRTWRTLFLSTGEIGLAQKIAEDGRGRRSTAGQEVRVIDIPADAGEGLGIFQDLHGFENAGLLAQHIKEKSGQLYGTPAITFLQRLVEDKAKSPNELRDATLGYQREFVEEVCPENAHGQVKRVAQRFGLVAAAGELAISLGVLPWGKGNATEAVRVCFEDWLAERDGTEPAEITAAIAQVRHFFEAHGESRFTPRDADPDNRVTINRAGYRKKNDDGEWEYFVLSEAWNSEICAGHDPKLVNKVLIERGLLIPDKSDEKVQSRHRLPDFKDPKRCYHVSAAILGR